MELFVFLLKEVNTFNWKQFPSNYFLILVKEVSKKDFKGQTTRSVLKPISVRLNQTNDSKNNRKGLKCVTSSLIQTENGLKISVDGLVGNNFTQQQIKIVKQKIINQYMHGEFVFFFFGVFNSILLGFFFVYLF